jgi:hypothetical protein
MIWYLSFADDESWRGGCFVETVSEELIEAVQMARALGCNPGGQVVGRPVRDPRSKVEAIMGEWGWRFGQLITSPEGMASMFKEDAGE